jgi:hypothetical protein
VQGHTFYFKSPIKIVIGRLEENRIDEMMYWRLIVDTTYISNDFTLSLLSKIMKRVHDLLP